MSETFSPVLIKKHLVFSNRVFTRVQYWVMVYECLQKAIWFHLPGHLYNKFRNTRRSNVSHYNKVILGAMASHITGNSIICSTVCSGADQRKYQSFASMAFVNSPHKGPVTQKIIPFDDVIMQPIVEAALTSTKHCDWLQSGITSQILGRVLQLEIFI